MRELTEATIRMKIGKASGSVNITPEVVKYMGTTGIQSIQRIMEEEKHANEWEIEKLFLLYKIGDWKIIKKNN